MLNMSNQSINMDGQSIVDEIIVANMSASANGTEDVNNGVYFNMSVMDADKFLANKDIVLADFNAFCEKVVELMIDVNDAPAAV